MGSGMNFHMHLAHHNDDSNKMKEGVPKGCMVVMVGLQGEEQLQRFVVPILYINHPLFINLLKEAEDEYGFHHVGPITIPCHVAQFRNVQGIIDQDHHHHDNHHHFLCFKA